MGVLVEVRPYEPMSFEGAMFLQAFPDFKFDVVTRDDGKHRDVTIRATDKQRKRIVAHSSATALLADRLREYRGT